jgi:hypothetical protein
MDTRAEITERVNRLPPELHERVLRFLDSLANAEQKGQPGLGLLEFAGGLDPVSAQEMITAIEDGCERVDTTEW